MRLTYEWLNAEGACKGQLNRFNEMYPKGCEITTETLVDLATDLYVCPICLQEHPDRQLDIYWLMRHVAADGDQDYLWNEVHRFRVLMGGDPHIRSDLFAEAIAAVLPDYLRALGK